jgi:hypothetical protein
VNGMFWHHCLQPRVARMRLRAFAVDAGTRSRHSGIRRCGHHESERGAGSLYVSVQDAGAGSRLECPRCLGRRGARSHGRVRHPGGRKALSSSIEEQFKALRGEEPPPKSLRGRSQSHATAIFKNAFNCVVKLPRFERRGFRLRLLAQCDPRQLRRPSEPQRARPECRAVVHI